MSRYTEHIFCGNYTQHFWTVRFASPMMQLTTSLYLSNTRSRTLVTNFLLIKVILKPIRINILKMQLFQNLRGKNLPKDKNLQSMLNCKISS